MVGVVLDANGRGKPDIDRDKVISAVDSPTFGAELQ